MEEMLLCSSLNFRNHRSKATILICQVTKEMCIFLIHLVNCFTMPMKAKLTNKALWAEKYSIPTCQNLQFFEASRRRSDFLFYLIRKHTIKMIILHLLDYNLEILIICTAITLLLTHSLNVNKSDESNLTVYLSDLIDKTTICLY